VPVGTSKCFFNYFLLPIDLRKIIKNKLNWVPFHYFGSWSHLFGIFPPDSSEWTTFFNHCNNPHYEYASLLFIIFVRMNLASMPTDGHAVFMAFGQLLCCSISNLVNHSTNKSNTFYFSSINNQCFDTLTQMKSGLNYYSLSFEGCFADFPNTVVFFFLLWRGFAMSPMRFCSENFQNFSGWSILNLHHFTKAST
jgi:hypothetical protein